MNEGLFISNVLTTIIDDETIVSIKNDKAFRIKIYKNANAFGYDMFISHGIIDIQTEYKDIDIQLLKILTYILSEANEDSRNFITIHSYTENNISHLELAYRSFRFEIIFADPNIGITIAKTFKTIDLPNLYEYNIPSESVHTILEYLSKNAGIFFYERIFHWYEEIKENYYLLGDDIDIKKYSSLGPFNINYGSDETGTWLSFEYTDRDKISKLLGGKTNILTIKTLLSKNSETTLTRRIYDTLKDTIA